MFMLLYFCLSLPKGYVITKNSLLLFVLLRLCIKLSVLAVCYPKDFEYYVLLFVLFDKIK